MYLQRITIGIAAATLVAGSTVAFAASRRVPVFMSQASSK